MSSLDLFRLDGQAALVIGGAGGLGSAIARGLAEAGASVCVADSNAEQAARVAQDIGGRAIARSVDVSDAAGVEALTADVEESLGPIEVLINSAGITHRCPAAEFPEAEWHRVIAVNLTGVWLASQAVGRRMIARKRGRIVSLASIAGQIGLTGTVAYAASKGGVVMLTRALATEWAPHGVRVNAIAPSWFESQIGDLIHREPGYQERSMRRVPFGRMGKPDELVGAALYLASEASSMVTGHVLAVDGGVLAS
jgi:NAD(P)-dependent dehydrogenase (short-subunit alcohol dehydrogenase family)